MEPNKVHLMDCVAGMRELPAEYAQVVVCDPPYNIGKDFGNDSDRQQFDDYIEWSCTWIAEAYRILRPDGTLYIYGFSEILAHIQVRCLPPNAKVRWLIWHYTNKNVPSCKFWQRSHESILCVWKPGAVRPHFNLDDVREPYTETFLRNAAGKTRKATKGRFSKGTEETTYNAHEKGALPRDVIKMPALAGGAGRKERVNHPTQKPLDLCNTLILAARDAQHQHPIVVPFAGSGSECVVCAQLNIPFIAFEINPVYVELCNDRLANASAVSETS
jgi:site-specific DNA-methyltransferase (adenine-specific)